MTAILDVSAREILDSRGNPMLEVDVITLGIYFFKHLLRSPANGPAQLAKMLLDHYYSTK